MQFEDIAEHLFPLVQQRVVARCGSDGRREPGRVVGRVGVPAVADGGGVGRPALSFNGHAGTNKIKFQGRLSRTKRLSPGPYTLTLTATDSAGNRSNAKATSFTIVRG
ncbi:MAG TPA: hypothetical protein VGN78_15860 [Solirubrobacteraceae bacterium]|nr:hypothetical protein [Solirubrobacteraceae bacterium]